MGIGKPTKPARIRSLDKTMTISTPSFGSTDGTGMPIRTLASESSNVRCRLNTITPGEAARYGHVVNETAYRLICPVKSAAGSDITIRKDQYVTIDSVNYSVLGDGRPEGRGGMQTAILKKERR